MSRLAGFLDDSVEVRRLGTEYLSRYPEEADRDALVPLLFAGLDLFPFRVEAERLHESFHRQIGADFENGRTLRFGGWILSRTELRLCALAELRSRELQFPSVEGMFEPEEQDGHRLRWTSGTAAFYVSAESTAVDLRFRSPAPMEQRVTFLLGRREVNALTLRDNAWHQFLYLLPCSGQRHLAADHGSETECVEPRAANFRVELLVAPTWEPSNDFRTLGIQLAETPWTV